MTEQAPAAQAPAAQAGIQVLAQYVKDFSFENPHAPESLMAGWGQPETNVQIALRHQKLRDDLYECVLGLRLEATKKEEGGAKGKTFFIIDLAYGAIAQLHNIPKENHQAVVMIEVPKLIFPFARQIISEAAAQGGYPPLYLAPINFEAMYVAEMQKLQAEKAAQGAKS